MAAADTPVDLNMIAGLPYRRRFRVTNGKDIWSELAQFEVRSDIRRTKFVTSEKLGDLDQFMTPAFEGNDIVVDLALTGGQTRGLVPGYYDVILSDIGTDDARALQISVGKVKIKGLTTAASG